MGFSAPSTARLIAGALTLSGCNASKTAAPSPSPSVSSTSGPAGLKGQYRVDAIVALNDAGKKELGADRLSIEDSMRKSMKGGAFVYARWVVIFSDTKLTVRMDSIFRFKSGFQWGWCEAEGTALWDGKFMNLPAGVATHGESGFVDKDSSHAGNCNANVGPGKYTLKQEGGETLLLLEREGKLGGLVLVEDATKPDMREQARALAGYDKN